jgi:heme oxygenase
MVWPTLRDADRRLLRDQSPAYLRGVVAENTVGNASLAACLREATGPLHASIERTLSLATFELSFPVYRRILGAFLGFYTPLEARLVREATQSGDIDLLGREKVALLRKDLRTLGATPEGLAALPLCRAVPRIDGMPRALGCMYVLEGATLGGQLIARRLNEHLGIDVHSGGAFFAAYGAETGAMWRAFVARLNRQPPPFDSTLAAAVETFEQLQGWFVAQGAPTWVSERAPSP